MQQDEARLLQIYQIAEGYCYNSDSLFLWDFIISNLHHKQKVLEIGSGSGIIGLLCAREKNIALYQIEKQREYALLNAKNASINHISSHIIHADCVALLESKNFIESFNASFLSNHYDLAKNHICDTQICSGIGQQIMPLQYFDIVISNPPFYSHNTLPSENPLKQQATQNKNLPLDSMIGFAKKILKPHGKFIFCYAPSMISDIFTFLQEYGFRIESLRFVYPKMQKNASLVLICARRNSKAQTHILPPLITHIGNNQLDNSLEVQQIYVNARTYSIKIHLQDIIWEELESI